LLEVPAEAVAVQHLLPLKAVGILVQRARGRVSTFVGERGEVAAQNGQDGAKLGEVNVHLDAAIAPAATPLYNRAAQAVFRFAPAANSPASLKLD
jgi:hypothetical protein